MAISLIELVEAGQATKETWIELAKQTVLPVLEEGPHVEYAIEAMFEAYLKMGNTLKEAYIKTTEKILLKEK